MVITQPQNQAELKQALAALIAGPGSSSAETDQQVQALVRYSESRGLSLEQCLIGTGPDHTTLVCLCVDSPGRTSGVYIPATIAKPQTGKLIVELLNEASLRARTRNIQFLQAIVPIDSDAETGVLQAAGFSKLAKLIYLESDLARPLRVEKPPPPLSWLGYSQTTHPLFANTIAQTYEGSLDCASLNGLRRIEDILASHRATGVFSPRFWFLGTLDSEPVGVILLSSIPEQSSYEVVYMGVGPRWRGQGYASALLSHGVRVARDEAALSLTLAVDAKNNPARKLYARFGFREVSRRCAWIKMLT
jgi:mycothiol synthase